MSDKKKVHFVDSYILSPYHPLTVNVIGAGGTGSQVLSALARINSALLQLGHPGIHVTTYDGDIVTKANLGRQMFMPTEIGMNKAVCLTTRINRFFGFGWDAVDCEYPDKDKTVANITITCVDSVRARISIGEFLRNNKDKTGRDEVKPYYWLDFGNTADSGQVIIGTVKEIMQPFSQRYEGVGKLPCVDEMFDLTQVNDDDSGPSCSLAEALKKQDLFINSTLTQLGCNILWKMFSGSLDIHGAYLNLRSMKVNPISV